MNNLNSLKGLFTGIGGKLLKSLIPLLILNLLPSICAAQVVISDGLTLTIPSPGSTNWAESFKDDFATPISGHDHTGSGDGVQLSTDAYTANSVTGAKIRLANEEWLRARNNAGSADVDLLRLNSSDEAEFGAVVTFSDAVTIDDLTTVAADLQGVTDFSGAVLGTIIQDWDDDLDDIAALTPTLDNFMVGDGTDWVLAAPAAVKTALSLGDLASRNSVNASYIDADAVGASEIAAGAVGTSEVADNSLTADDLAADSVGASEIAANAVGASEIATDAVGAAEIAAGAVGTSEIATDGVGSAEIAAGAVGTSEVANNSLTADDLAANSVTSSELDITSITSLTSLATIKPSTGNLTIGGDGAGSYLIIDPSSGGLSAYYWKIKMDGIYPPTALWDDYTLWTGWPSCTSCARTYSLQPSAATTVDNANAINTLWETLIGLKLIY